MRRLIPSILTLVGLALGFAGIFLHFWPLLIASLAFDIADGAVARTLEVVTTEGARLDWSVDVLLCGALIIAMPLPYGLTTCGLVIGLLLYTISLDKRASGRTLATAMYLLALWRS